MPACEVAKQRRLHKGAPPDLNKHSQRSIPPLNLAMFVDPVSNNEMQCFLHLISENDALVFRKYHLWGGNRIIVESYYPVTLYKFSHISFKMIFRTTCENMHFPPRGDLSTG